MDTVRTLWAACAVALAVLLHAMTPGHAAFQQPCHEADAAAAVNGQPCGDQAAAPDMACCLSASCTAPAWTLPASAACPQPSWKPAPAAFAQPGSDGDGILLRPVLPPPRTA